MATLKEIVARAIKDRESRTKESRDFLLIDAIIGHHPDDADRRFGDVMAYAVGGFHSTGNCKHNGYIYCTR